jgi:hypothetical protein
METEIHEQTMSLNEYAEYAAVNPRTVKRWLKADEIPAAYKDPFSGEWRFPAGATRIQRPVGDTPMNGQEVTVAAGSAMLPTEQHAWFPHPGEVIEDEPTRLEMLDEENSFLTIERAARFLGIPQAQIRANAEMFGVLPVGRLLPNGTNALMVPKSTIRKFEGK